MSVFTFETAPQRASSPWLDAPESSEAGVTKLKPEPQDGSIEYKLHLLLRPRRKYERISTPIMCGSIQSRAPLDVKSTKAPPAVGSASNTGRENRLHSLTTQLLWRLQQSCLYHATSGASRLVVPQLPDEQRIFEYDIEQIKPGRPLPGIEASMGALYEIGVADDGTLVGLTKDELNESLVILRIMAASLGCNVKITRQVVVGDCEWVESSDSEDSSGSSTERARHHEQLFVAEAKVTPNLESTNGSENSPTRPANSLSSTVEDVTVSQRGPLTTDQLRVTLTGPTASGKSTLLGTLSAGTLDDGRGSNRLNLHRHPHEVNAGMTSSITQELIGYNNDKVINYKHPGVESWVDIHTFTETGRLAFLSDSAGNLKYRRTVFRGLVGLAPHWTFLCIAGDSGEKSKTSSAQEGVGIETGLAYLDLCLQLKLPLGIVITKIDLATKPMLGSVLAKILTRIKNAGRSYKLLPPDPSSHHDSISEQNHEAVRPVLEELTAKNDLKAVIPIVLTSSVDGKGIGTLHALLQSLPLPPGPTSRDFIGAALNPEQPKCLFHIEETYTLTASSSLATQHTDQQTDQGTVIAGHLRFGNISIGNKVVVGPFPPEDGSDSPRGSTPDDRLTPGSYGLSVSHHSSTELSRIASSKSLVSASTTKGEWHIATIVSIHNLRLPVQTLTAGQAGSVGIVFKSLTSTPRIRKGMVLAIASDHMDAEGLSLQAASGLTVVFEDMEAASLAVNTVVHIYVASVRATAKVLAVQKGEDIPDARSRVPIGDVDEMFSLSEEMENTVLEAQSEIEGSVKVQLELLSKREWIEMGSKILVLEGDKHDRLGLEGFMGTVVEIEE